MKFRSSAAGKARRCRRGGRECHHPTYVPILSGGQGPPLHPKGAYLFRASGSDPQRRARPAAAVHQDGQPRNIPRFRSSAAGKARRCHVDLICTVLGWGVPILSGGQGPPLPTRPLNRWPLTACSDPQRRARPAAAIDCGIRSRFVCTFRSSAAGKARRCPQARCRDRSTRSRFRSSAAGKARRCCQQPFARPGV